MAQLSNTQQNLFPAWDLAGKAYRSLFKHFAYALRISWAWIALVAGAVVAADLITAPAGVEASGEETSNWLTVLLLWLLLGAAVSSIAVAWHRLLLLGEKVSDIVYLRLDAHVAVYFGYAMAVFLISLAPYALLWAVTSAVTYGDTLIFTPAEDGRTPADVLFSQQGLFGFPLFQIAAFILFVILNARLGLALPGVAIGARERTLIGAWKTTKGHSWGLFVGTGICVLPYLILMGLIRGSGLEFSPADGALLHILDRVGMQTLFVLLGLVGVGFLAQCFRYFHPASSAMVRRS